MIQWFSHLITRCIHLRFHKCLGAYYNCTFLLFFWCAFWVFKSVGFVQTDVSPEFTPEISADSWQLPKLHLFQAFNTFILSPSCELDDAASHPANLVTVFLPCLYGERSLSETERIHGFPGSSVTGTVSRLASQVPACLFLCHVHHRFPSAMAEQRQLIQKLGYNTVGVRIANSFLVIFLYKTKASSILIWLNKFGEVVGTKWHDCRVKKQTHTTSKKNQHLHDLFCKLSRLLALEYIVYVCIRGDIWDWMHTLYIL